MNEQQHLEEVIGRFLQDTQEKNELAKEDKNYLKRRIRPAMEYLIDQEQIDGMRKLAGMGWFGDRELTGFLTRAGEREKWDAFRVLLAWKNHGFPEEESSATDAEQNLVSGLIEQCRNELCWRYPELGRALLELRVQSDEETAAMQTDGETLYVNPEYLIHLFGKEPEKVYEEYLRLIRQCLAMPEASGEETAKQKAIRKKWKEIAEELAITYGTGGKRRGENRGGQREELSETEKGKYDYRRFLRRFTVTREEMRLDQDAFDPVAYYYGMERYGNLPMMEPLETREGNRLEELVIAIDTSGSCKKETVARFLGETRTILEEKENFFENWNVCLIQCDSFIQEKVMIHSAKEWETYREQMVIRGRGGTDFRPVFEEVERMREKREFRDLKALIYYTDGDGIYPEKKPDYETAFVFVKKSEKMDRVPGWAKKLLVTEK